MRVAIALVVGILMTGWVAVDADRRGRNWFAWAALVALTGVIGFVVWLTARQRAVPAPEPAGVGRRARLFLTAIPLILVTFMVTGFVITFIFHVARVEGGAMAPTLANQDRVIVNKLVYQLGEPGVGDIVMMHYPLDPEKVFVKRVIAEEGDQVRLVRGRVFRNDVPLDEPFVAPQFRSQDDWGPEVIPEGYYFVMGDHRNNSSDSRHWRFVPKKYIVGRIQCRWWPIATARCF